MNLEKVFELYLQTLRGPLKVNLGAEIFQNWQFELRPSFPWTEQMQKLLLIYTLSMVNKVFFTRFGVLCWLHTGRWRFQVNGTGKQPGLPSGYRMCRSSLEQRIKDTENLVF